MASRSPEATGNGWGHDDHANRTTPDGIGRVEQDRVAADASPERRVEALEAELERRDRQLQLVVDHYESMLEDAGDTGGGWRGLLGRLRDLLRG